MEEALNTAEKNIFVNNSYGLFLTKYLSAREKLLANQTRKMSFEKSCDNKTTDFLEITNDCLNLESVKKLKSIYKKGLVFYTSDAASSSTSYFG